MYSYLIVKTGIDIVNMIPVLQYGHIIMNMNMAYRDLYWYPCVGSSYCNRVYRYLPYYCNTWVSTPMDSSTYTCNGTGTRVPRVLSIAILQSPTHWVHVYRHCNILQYCNTGTCIANCKGGTLSILWKVSTFCLRVQKRCIVYSIQNIVKIAWIPKLRVF